MLHTNSVDDPNIVAVTINREILKALVRINFGEKLDCSICRKNESNKRSVEVLSVFDEDDEELDPSDERWVAAADAAQLILQDGHGVCIDCEEQSRQDAAETFQ